jgi:hypothetical protein
MKRAVRGPSTAVLAAVIAMQALSGCIVEAPGGERRRTGAAGTVVGSAAPLQVQTAANLEDKVEIVGARLEPGRALPGEAVKVTVWFKALEAIPQDYLIFVHVEDVDGRMERMNVDHSPAGGTRPTSGWNKGETIADSFQIQVPPGAQLRGLNVWLGFWHEPTDTRLKLRNAEKVRNDGRDRILLAMLPVGAS